MIELDGTNAQGLNDNGLHIIAGGSTVRGLVINRFGGSGIRLATNGSNVIQGNFIGVNVTGTVDLGNSGVGVTISEAPNNTIGGETTGARNIISANNSQGVFILGSGATGNLVQGNFIGTDVTGTAALGNTGQAVLIFSSNNTIGGVTAGLRNVISGNNSSAVAISGAEGGGTGNLVQGNFIGTEVGGVGPLGNGSHGVVVIFNASDNTVGGTAVGAGNIIAFNSGNGVQVQIADTTAILGNSIFSNGPTSAPAPAPAPPPAPAPAPPPAPAPAPPPAPAPAPPPAPAPGPSPTLSTPGIDLVNGFFGGDFVVINVGTIGVTPNDPGDADTGTNNLQNSPDISRAEIDNTGNLVIEYSVDSATANSAYPLRIEFFEADSAASGEGKTFLGSDSYPASSAQSSNASSLGNAAGLGVASGDVIVATATDANNNTSEFSQGVEVTAVATPIPGLTQWGLIAMAGLMVAVLLWRMRRSRSLGTA